MEAYSLTPSPPCGQPSAGSLRQTVTRRSRAACRSALPPSDHHSLCPSCLMSLRVEEFGRASGRFPSGKTSNFVLRCTGCRGSGGEAGRPLLNRRTAWASRRGCLRSLTVEKRARSPVDTHAPSPTAVAHQPAVSSAHRSSSARACTRPPSRRARRGGPLAASSGWLATRRGASASGPPATWRPCRRSRRA